MKQILLTILISLLMTSMFAQREVIMSQYMYNKYVINPAFGGSHEALSLYGSYRKQWLGFENSPNGAFFSAHSPLKNEKIALGVQFYNEKVAVSNNTGGNISYTYRIALKNESQLTFGVYAGLINYKSNWTDVALVHPGDEVFKTSEQSSAPWLGFGVGLYHDKYFAGISIPSLIYHDRYESAENSLDFNKLDYLATGGYLFEITNNFALQPSVLVRINPDMDSFIDVGVTSFLLNSFMLGASYRTTNEIIGILGYQITSQFRFTYSLDYDIDPIGSYNNGTHEVAVQFDFGYKINSPNPKFF